MIPRIKGTDADGWMRCAGVFPRRHPRGRRRGPAHSPPFGSTAPVSTTTGRRRPVWNAAGREHSPGQRTHPSASVPFIRGIDGIGDPIKETVGPVGNRGNGRPKEQETVNMPQTDEQRVLPEELRRFARQVLDACGLPPGDAARAGRRMVGDDHRGGVSHGTRQLPRYVGNFLGGVLNPAPQVRVVQESPATAVVEGDGGLGHFAAHRAAEVAIAKAKEAGTAAVVARGHGHIGAAGSFTRMALPHGCAALCVSGVDVRSHRTRRPTRSVMLAGAGGPISLAVPAGAEPPLVLDMGCYIRGAWQRLDEVCAAAPDAVLKVFAMSTATMALGGILAGVSLPADPDDRRWYAANQGTFLAVFDLARFLPLDEFLPAMDDWIRGTRTLDPLPGFEHAELPGGPEWRHEGEWATAGIPLNEKHLQALDDVAGWCGVALPVLEAA